MVPHVDEGQQRPRGHPGCARDCARAGSNADLDGAPVLRQTRPAALAAAAGIDERRELVAVGVREQLPVVLGEAGAIARGQHAARLADEDGAFAADDLATHVVAERAGARDVCHRSATVVEANRDERVVEVAESLELRVDARLPYRRYLDGLPAEEPADGVVVVHCHVEQEAARVLRQLARGPLHVATRGEYDERLPDRAFVDDPFGLEETRVEAPLVTDLHDDAVRCAQEIVAGEGGRAGLLEEQVLAGGEHRGRHLGMVDRAGGHDDRLDVAAGDQLVVAARGDAELRADLLGSSRPGRGDRHEARAGQLERVPRVHDAHAAEACHADSNRIA